LEPPPIPLEKAAEVAAALFEGFFAADVPAPALVPVATPSQVDSSPLTLAEAARAVGLAPRSLSKRIIASGGKLIWAQCGRTPGKKPLFERKAFFEWWNSPANISPPRTKRDRKRRR
jgi:hypothetical protein